MCLVRFDAGHERGLLLAVGTAEGMTFFPTDCRAGYIRLYRCVCLCVLGWTGGLVGGDGAVPHSLATIPSYHRSSQSTRPIHPLPPRSNSPPHQRAGRGLPPRTGPQDAARGRPRCPHALPRPPARRRRPFAAAVRPRPAEAAAQVRVPAASAPRGPAGGDGQPRVCVRRAGAPGGRAPALHACLACLPRCLSVWLSVCLSVFLSVSPSVPLSTGG